MVKANLLWSVNIVYSQKSEVKLLISIIYLSNFFLQMQINGFTLIFLINFGTVEVIVKK